jgi:AraC-like DNA-binding protein
VPGGDASLTLVISEPQLREMAPRAFLRGGAALAFRHQRLRIDPRAQALVALLRHSLRQNIAEPLEAESLALTLVQRALGPRTTHAAGATAGCQRLVDRVKLVLMSDLARRWTLAEIAAEVRGSPVYLTQVFQQVEGLPLYRYQLRLRLARALDLLAQYDDLTTLSLDLGFSSHSHFSAAFRQAYGRSPSNFRRSALRRWRRGPRDWRQRRSILNTETMRGRRHASSMAGASLSVRPLSPIPRCCTHACRKTRTRPVTWV